MIKKKVNITSKELLSNTTGIEFKIKTDEDMRAVGFLTFLYNQELLNKIQAQLILIELQVSKKNINKVLVGRNYITKDQYLKSIIEYSSAQ